MAVVVVPWRRHMRRWGPDGERLAFCHRHRRLRKAVDGVLHAELCKVSREHISREGVYFTKLRNKEQAEASRPVIQLLTAPSE